MKKLFFILLLVPSLCRAEDSIPPDVIKYKFVLALNSAEYWYLTAEDMMVVDSLQKEVIATYAELTGVQAASRDDLRSAYELKNGLLNECPANLQKSVEEVKRLERKVHRKNRFIKIGMPVSLLVGFGTGIYITTRLN